MSAWLHTVAQALDRRAATLEVFFRDDDAGWSDERLFALLTLFERHELPLDLAVIPEAIGPDTAARLAHRAHLSDLLGLHQHGFTHTNHEPQGRACEFGPSRSEAAQRADIASGRERLLMLFGSEFEPIFTPPWNRCTSATGACLVEAGIPVLSRDASAAPLGVPGLVECPIASDWLKKRHRVPLTRDEWASSFADLIGSATAPVGVMLHHAVMDDDNRQALGELLRLLRTHGRVRAMRMWQVVARRLVMESERKPS